MVTRAIDDRFGSVSETKWFLIKTPRFIPPWHEHYERGIDTGAVELVQLEWRDSREAEKQRSRGDVAHESAKRRRGGATCHFGSRAET